ncbi:MAG: tetratricopeptide repeat protein [Phycisphaeraceae bacterium]|nr:tetratricopeptide repeat protein [Phycisphaeraceae bacterium]
MTGPVPQGVFDLISAGKLAEAADQLKRLASRPAGAREPAVLASLGRVLVQMRQVEQGAFYLQRAAEVSGDPSLLGEWGGVLMALGRYEEAERACRRCVDAVPDSAAAWVNLANAVAQRGRPGEAVSLFERALTIDPAHADAAASLAQTLGQMGLADRGLAVLESLSRVRDDTLTTLLTRATLANYADGVPPERVAAWHRAFGAAQERAVARAQVERLLGHAGGPCGSSRRGNAGGWACFSSDLREHSVAYFLLPMLEHRDRAATHVTCYSLVKRDDAMRRRLKGAADTWRDVGDLNDRDLLTLLRKDRLDALLDLIGHNGPGRQGVLSAGAAPVQVTAIGYPATTGLTGIDWRLCDGRTDPPGAERLLTERPLRLDGCFLCYSPPPVESLPPVEAGPAERAGQVRFGSFNNVAKLGDGTLDVWGRVLRETPASALVLKSRWIDDPVVSQRVVSRLEARGVERSRISVLPYAAGTREHLEQYREIDVALDPWPYNGTTTTCEALLMGVPVVSLAGAAHAGRVGLSLLHAAGQSRWAAPDAETYVRTATELAARPLSLAQRRDVRDGLLSSSLCDGKAYAAGIWRALRRAAATGRRVYLSDAGRALAAAGRWAEAAEMLGRAAEQEPYEPAAWSNLVASLLHIGKRAEALAACERGLEILGDDADLIVRRAALDLESGDADGAVERLRRGAARFPRDATICRELATALPYAPGADGPAIRAAHERLAALHAAAQRPVNPAPPADRPLRIGVLSGDLRLHSVAYFLEPLMEHLEVAGGRAWCYATQPCRDTVSDRLRALSAGWREITDLAAGPAAAMIAADGLDVLLDLAGPLPGGRHDVLSLRPAPCIVNWLGYPATDGCAAVDARIVDSLTDPPGYEAHSLERLIRLDPCFVCYRPPAGSPEPGAQTPDGAPLTFGSFNKLAKVNDRLLELWAKVLGRAEGSRLLIKAVGLEDAQATEQLRARCAAAGIEPGRVEIAGPTAGLAEHLAMYRRVDVALDTWPYCGTTTTCEALWMGVPVVSLAGGHHAARVGLSLLTGAGLAELAAGDAAGYVAIAGALSDDRARLRRLRTGLRERFAAGAVCNGAGFAQRMVRALRDACGAAQVGGASRYHGSDAR